MTSDYLIPLAATLGFYVVYHLTKILHEEITSPLRDLPGPTGPHFILGHFKELQASAFNCLNESRSIGVFRRQISL
jgi:hypothetical protein